MESIYCILWCHLRPIIKNMSGMDCGRLRNVQWSSSDSDLKLVWGRSAKFLLILKKFDFQPHHQFSAGTKQLCGRDEKWAFMGQKLSFYGGCSTCLVVLSPLRPTINRALITYGWALVALVLMLQFAASWQIVFILAAIIAVDSAVSVCKTAGTPSAHLRSSQWGLKCRDLLLQHLRQRDNPDFILRQPREGQARKM